MFARRFNLKPMGFCFVFFILFTYTTAPSQGPYSERISIFYSTKLERNFTLSSRKLLFILDDEELPRDDGSQTERLVRALSELPHPHNLLIVSTARLIANIFALLRYRSKVMGAQQAWICKEISPSFYLFMPRQKESLTDYELGIKHHLFSRISFTQLEKQTTQLGTTPQLKYFFKDLGIQKKSASRFFVTHEEYVSAGYQNRELPLFIMMTGHGSPCTPNKRALASREQLPSFPTQAPFWEKNGFLCGLELKKMRKFVLFCHNKLTMNALLFSTCDGGGHVSERLLYSAKRNCFRDLNFPLIFRGCSSSSTFLVPNDTEQLLGDEQIDLQTALERLSLDDNIPSPNHLALVKWPGKNNIILYQPKSCIFVASDQFNQNSTAPFIISNKAGKRLFVLLGNTLVRRPLILDSSLNNYNPPVFLSVTRGDTLHILENVQAQRLSLNTFLASFFQLIQQEENKLFIIKNLSLGLSQTGIPDGSRDFSDVYIRQETNQRGISQRSILLRDTTNCLREGTVCIKETSATTPADITWRTIPPLQAAERVAFYEAFKETLLSYLIEEAQFNEQR